MRVPFVTIAVMAASAVFASLPVEAAIVSGTYTFTGSRFTAGAPQDPVTGSVTLTFDSASNTTANTANIAFSSPSITSASPVAFDYFSAANQLVIGGTSLTEFTTNPNAADFALYISNATTVPVVTFLSYSVGSGTAYVATRDTVTFAPAAAVPEPSSTALLVAGLAGAWASRRRRSRS